MTLFILLYLFIFYQRLLENRIFATNKDLFERINMKQSSWRAGVNAFHETATVGYMLKLAGGKNSIGIK